MLSAGELYTRAAYLQDGSLLVEQPHQLAVALETSPHPLLNTQHQLQLKRKLLQLPGGLTHRLEWRYYPRYQRGGAGGGGGRGVMTGVRRKMRVGAALLPDSTRHAVHDYVPPVDDPSTAYQLGYAGKSLAVCAPSVLTSTNYLKLLLLLVKLTKSTFAVCTNMIFI